MLHQEPQESTETAAQTRVTPEELAAAISRIEARKDAGQRHQQGTIPIGEAMQQLGLEATPEEVLAEVQAGRLQAMTKKRRPSVAARCVLALGLSGIVLGLTVVGNRISQIQHPQSEAQVFVSSAPEPISLDPNLLVGDTSGKLVMLSEVGDNQPVHCTYSEGRFQQFQMGRGVELWELIKHSGNVYVRGWMLKMSPKVLRANGADISTIYNPDFAMPVTLPLNGFQVLPQVGSAVEFHAVGIRLDKHAWEKWKP